MASKSTQGPVKGKKIPFADFIKHNVENDCWIAVRGRVYDVTSWVPKHPGGVDTIVLNGGRDATQLFECYHPQRVKQSLEKYYIGELDGSEYPEFPPMSEFYITMREKVDKYFADRNISPRYGPEMFVRIVILLAIMMYFHYLSVFTSSLPSFICAVIVGIASALLCFMPVHEGSHAATSSSPLVWRLMGAVHDFANGASFYNWCHQHFLGHHPFTNVTDLARPMDALDPDVVTNDPDIRRIKPTQSYHNHYRFQVYYAPLLYGLLGIKFRVSDFVILFGSKMNGHVRVNPMNTWHTVVFFAGKAFFLYYRIILPALYTSLSHSLFIFVVSDLVTSWILAFVFQVNHVVPQAKWPVVDKDTNKVNMDWAEMQIRTTLDYGHDSWWTAFFTGALNYQVIHHLFPYISQIHYPAIAPIVKQHCKEYNIPFNYLPTFWDAFTAHLTYLSKMGHAHYDF